MLPLSEKANQSLKSANILVKEHLYSSTVNRSYYACFQYLMHILFVKLKKDPTEFYGEVMNGKNGTHSWASKLISIELAKKDLDDYKWYQKEIPAIREKRVQADYHATVITSPEAYESIGKAEAIMNLLAKHFK
jgi:uncharacterized protein (UPF0332 family)